MTTTGRSVLSISVLCAACAVGCAPPSEEERPGTAKSAVLEGVEDDGHDAVIAIFVAPTSEMPMGGFCTGTFIAPNVVLTARHCLQAQGPAICEDLSKTLKADRVKAPVAADKVSVVIAKNAYDAQQRPVDPRPVKQIVVPPEEDLLLCGHDIALLVMEQAAPVTPAAPALGGPPVVGAKHTAVGYGYLRPSTGDGVRRSRSDLAVASVGEERTMGDLVSVANEWRADLGGCGGDSGGPAFDESGAVIGVHSRSQGCRNVTYTRIDPFAPWLRSAVHAATTAAGVPAPGWTEGGAPAAGDPAPTPPPRKAEAPAADEGSSGCAQAPASRGSSAWPLLVAAFAFLRRRSRAA